MNTLQFSATYLLSGNKSKKLNTVPNGKQRDGALFNITGDPNVLKGAEGYRIVATDAGGVVVTNYKTPDLDYVKNNAPSQSELLQYAYGKNQLHLIG